MSTYKQWSNAEQSPTDGLAAKCCLANFPEPSEGALDVLNLDELQNRCMGNFDLVRRILSKFQTRFPEDMAEMQAALGDGNTDQLARIAHRLKGTAASVSAKGLARAAAGLEDYTRSKSGSNFTLFLDRLASEWAKFQSEADRVMTNCIDD
ncbi:MAG: Hpt domain-containing protein [Pirellulaceae bacterium]|nr:Hpt domain-containing protein [Pirellulaceae bacterium]